jgi:hypothetical protein
MANGLLSAFYDGKRLYSRAGSGSLEQRGGLGQCAAAGPSLNASVLPVRIAENSHLTVTPLPILDDQDLTPSLRRAVSCSC